MNREQALEMLENGHKLCFGYERTDNNYEPLLYNTELKSTSVHLGIFITDEPVDDIYDGYKRTCTWLDWLPAFNELKKSSYSLRDAFGRDPDVPIAGYFKAKLICPKTLLPMTTT